METFQHVVIKVWLNIYFISERNPVKHTNLYIAEEGNFFEMQLLWIGGKCHT